MPSATTQVRPDDVRLRIGVIAPAWVPVPPPAYGGVEWVVHHLVEGLEARGHEVILVTVGGSTTRASKVITTFDPAPYSRMGEITPEVLHAVEAYSLLPDCDIVHDHTLAGPAIAWARGEPAVTTIHGPVDGEMQRYYRQLTGVRYIAISDAQRRRAPGLDWLGTIHHGIDVGGFPFRPRKEPYLAFLGRMTPDKGAAQAIEVARGLGLPLRMAAKLNERAEYEYFDAHVKPLLGPDVEFVGEVGGVDKLDLLANATALVAPIQWDEPFGMVFIEALACGTPVLSIARGSVPEIVDDGVTGLLAPDTETLIEVARARLYRLDPAACRRVAESRFGLDRFVRAHVAAFRRHLSERMAGAA